jgi:hypothetical protein
MPREHRCRSSSGPEKAMARPIDVCSSVDGVLDIEMLCFWIASVSSEGHSCAMRQENLRIEDFIAF